MGVALVLLSAVGFGSGPFFANAAYDAGMDAMPILFWRFTAAAGVAWGLVLAAALVAPRCALCRAPGC